MSWPRAIVCDLDGTLIDSLPDIAASLNATLEEARLKPLPVDAVRAIVGRGARVLIGEALDGQGAEQSPGLLDALYARFLVHYEAARATRTSLYPGVEAQLAAWQSDGIRLAICTNKPQAVTDLVVADLGLDRYFDPIIGVTDARPRKPDPAMLTACLDGMGVTAAGAVMIGDTATDVKIARAVGLPVVICSFGYARAPAGELGADAVVDAWSELPAAVLNLPTP
ncbi:MAG: HAD-IA family hydrolase [Pseudomonadota bacterium]